MHSLLVDTRTHERAPGFTDANVAEHVLSAAVVYLFSTTISVSGVPQAHYKRSGDMKSRGCNRMKTCRVGQG
jgi:hypothetical protein